MGNKDQLSDLTDRETEAQRREISTQEAELEQNYSDTPSSSWKQHFSKCSRIANSEHTLPLKLASVGGARLLSSSAAIVPTISGNSFRDMIFRAGFGVTKTAHRTGEPNLICGMRPLLVLLLCWV